MVNLKTIGREDDARRLFERLSHVANELGLLSEEYELKRKRQVGNFPQAFSHIALINAAFDFEDGAGARERCERRPNR